jgi:hypothetical protein
MNIGTGTSGGSLNTMQMAHASHQITGVQFGEVRKNT